MKSIISSALYLIILFCLSKFIFDPTHLYYELTWLDIPMHVLGGFGVASLVVSVAYYKKIPIALTRVMLTYLLVACVWELYELVSDLVSHMSWNGWGDTISDIINGAFGACAAFFLYKK